MALLGVIVAGGAARRMGGGDKTLRLLAGRTILARIVDRFAPQVDRLVLNANGDPARFSDTGLPVLPDITAGLPGPLAGVLAGLVAAGGDDVLTVPGDAPFLPADLAARLRQARAATGAVMAVACSGGRMHPVVALWSPAAAAPLRQALDERRLGVGAFVECLPHAVVEWSDRPYDPFLNLNTPADFAEADRILTGTLA